MKKLLNKILTIGLLFGSMSLAIAAVYTAPTLISPTIIGGTISNSTFIINSASAVAASSVNLTSGPNSAGGSLSTIGSATNTATSGQQFLINLTDTYNQASGTASNTDIFLNRTQTAVGSGTQKLIDLQVDSLSKFSVRSNGSVVTTLSHVGSTSAAVLSIALDSISAAAGGVAMSRWLGSATTYDNAYAGQYLDAGGYYQYGIFFDRKTDGTTTATTPVAKFGPAGVAVTGSISATGSANFGATAFSGPITGGQPATLGGISATSIYNTGNTTLTGNQLIVQPSAASNATTAINRPTSVQSSQVVFKTISPATTDWAIGTAQGSAGLYDFGLYNYFAAGLAFSVTQSTNLFNIYSSLAVTGAVNATTTYGFTHILESATAPTVSSGFGTSATIQNANGTAAFTVNVGTGGAASTGVLTMPAANVGWACTVAPNGAPQAAAVTYSAPTSSTSITLTNYTASTGIALAWTASTVLQVRCAAY